MKSPINQQLAKTQEALLKNTATPVGPTTSESAIPQADHIEAISRLFAEFELVYHNQYTKAFGSQEKLNYARRLWYSHLQPYSPEVILQAAKLATRESEYLPTVHTMLSACDRILGENGLPTASQAYREACLAGTPKAQYDWSHPIVYLAGKDTGWRFLHETAERVALPAFTENYSRWRNRVLNGETVSMPANPHTSSEASPEPLSKADQLAHLETLRNQTQL